MHRSGSSPLTFEGLEQGYEECSHSKWTILVCNLEIMHYLKLSKFFSNLQYLDSDSIVMLHLDINSIMIGISPPVIVSL